MGASFHSSATFTFEAKAIVVDGMESVDPSKDSFVAVDVLTEVYLRDDRPTCVLSFNIDRDTAEDLVRRLQRAIAELPKPKPTKPHVVRGPYKAGPAA